MTAGPRRTIVKVCGLTRQEDAAHALACGVDWLGFVVKGGSPRLVRPELAGEIVASLDNIIAVAVMVAPTADEALAIASRMQAKRIQLHRVDARTWPTDFPLPCAFTMGVDASGAFHGEEPMPGHLILLDTAHEKLAGGTGSSFPWEAALALAQRRDVMLAGGLDANNVVAALEAADPYGVDASSRLESSPGVKDSELVRRYVAAVREYDEHRNAATR